MEIYRQPDKKSAAAEAGEYLNKLLTDSKAKPVLLMLSAGSALSVLDYVGKNALGQNLTVSMLDERFSQDPSVNNFEQLQKTNFYKDALEAEASFFGTLPRNKDTMQTLVQRWEKNLRNWRAENPKGIIIATLGMGADGHTAGILPFADADDFQQLFENPAWITAYNAGDKNPFKERTTASVTFLKMVDIGLAFVCGAEKKAKLEDVVAKKGELNKLPALAWHEIKNLKIFTDIQK